MDQALRIRVGSSLTILGRPDFERGPVEGLFVEKDGFTGWESGTEVRRDEVVIPGGHGSFDTPGLLSARVVSISGYAIARSQEKLGHLRGMLTGAGAAGDKLRIIVDLQGETLWADGRLTGQPSFVDSGGVRRARFQTQFWFPDPRKYGDTRTSASGAGAFHYGNFPASPVITVTGSMPSGYTITGPVGRTYVVTQALTSGHAHRIDMRTGRLYLDGVLQVGAVSVGQTWAVPGGAAVVHTLTPVSGTGVLSVAVTDTFI